MEQVAEIKVSYNPSLKDKPIIKTSADAHWVFKGFFAGETICLQEQFSVMYLNRCNRMLGVYNVSKGGMTGTIADIRLILVVALKVAATSIILCHNHPSGNLQPSNDDLTLTKKIKEAGALMDIKVHDHLVITRDDYKSFADEGLM